MNLGNKVATFGGGATAAAATAAHNADPGAHGKVAAALLTAYQRGARSARLVLLSDSTGNDISEWCYLLAQKLAVRFPAWTVDAAFWNVGDFFNAPTRLQTGTAGDPYLICGASGSYGSVTAATAPSLTGIQKWQFKRTCDSWVAAGTTTIWEHFGSSGNRSIRFSRVGDGSTCKLQFAWSPDGTATAAATSTVGIALEDAAVKWVQVAFDPDKSGSYECKFATSDDGSTWTPLGDAKTGAATTIFAGTADWTFGATPGRIYEVRGFGASGALAFPHWLDAFTRSTTNGGTWGGSPALTVSICAISGATFATWYDATRLGKTYLSDNDTAVIVALGHNEAQKTPTAFKAELDSLLSKIQTKAPGIPVAFCTQNPQVSPAANGWWQAGRDVFLPGWCQRNAADFVNVAAVFTDPATQIQADGVHPTSAGSEVWAGLLTGALAP